jgi:hypothetical protein
VSDAKKIPVGITILAVFRVLFGLVCFLILIISYIFSVSMLFPAWPSLSWKELLAFVLAGSCLFFYFINAANLSKAWEGAWRLSFYLDLILFIGSGLLLLMHNPFMIVLFPAAVVVSVVSIWYLLLPGIRDVFLERSQNQSQRRMFSLRTIVVVAIAAVIFVAWHCSGQVAGGTQTL